MNNVESPEPKKTRKPIYTLLSLIIPVIILILTILLLPILSEGSDEFMLMVAGAYLGLGIIIGALVGLFLGIVALIRRERFRGVVLIPIVLSIIVLNLICALYFA